MNYYAYTYDKVMINKNFEELFGLESRKEDAETKQIHYDIGASAQLVLEEVLLKMVNHIHKKCSTTPISFIRSNIISSHIHIVLSNWFYII